MDVNKLIRMKHAVIAAADGLPSGQEAVAGEAYASVYDSLRAEVRGSVPGHLIEEFDRLFGELRGAARRGSDLFGQAGMANEAKLQLQTMVGWLEGIIQSDKSQ